MSTSSILIVEDETIVAADLAHRLEQLGYAVAGSAVTGERAVELARLNRPSLVLMDIRLAGPMDGITAAETIRREFDIPVVLLTAHTDLATLERAKAAEAFGYVSKPFEERDLRSSIEIAISKHRSEQLVRQQREWLRVTLTSIGDAVITCDTEARITFLNPVAEGLTGWKVSEALGLPIRTVLRLINELTHEPAEDPIAAVLMDRCPVKLANHTMLQSKDGREIPIEDSAAPIMDAAGKLVGVVLVFHDVSERRKAAEALHTAHHRTLNILESITDGYFSLDWDYRVTHINERGAQLIGKARDVLLNRSLWESFPEAVGSPFQHAYERTLVERIPTTVESFYPPLNAWFEARAFPSREGLSVFYRDITERKRVEDTLRFLAEAGSRPGGNFFKALARHLSQTLGMEYICIDLLQEGSLAAQTVAVFHNGKFESNVSYTLKDTPCGQVVGQRVCCFPNNVCRLFPRDVVLQDLLAESYIGITLWSTAGRPIGLIAAIGRHPLVNPSLAESILQLVAGRAAAEMERRQTEEAREQHLSRLNFLVDISKDVLAATSSTELMQKVLNAAQKLTTARLGVCGRVSGDGRFEVEVAAPPGKAWLCPRGESFFIETGGAPWELVQGRNTVRYTESQLQANPQLRGLPAKLNLRGLLGARLAGKPPQVSGLLLLSDKATGEFTSEDEALLGQLAGLCAVGLQRLEASERAEQRADQLATVFSAMTDSVMILNTDGIMVDANLAAVQAYGFNPINQTLQWISGRVELRYADGKSVPPRRLPSRRALAGEVVRAERFVFSAADGKPRTIVASAAPLRTRGSVTGAVVVWHDVTERESLLQRVAQARDELELRVAERTADLQHAMALLQASEQRYRTLFEAAPLGIAVTTRAGQVLDANPTLCQLLGFSLEEAKMLSAANLYAHRGDRRRLVEQLRREGLVPEFETLLRRKDGQLVPAQLQVNGLTLGGQSVLLTMVQDLTRRKQAERRIQGISKVLELFATKPSRGEYIEAAVQLLHDWCGCSGVGIRLLDTHGGLAYAASLGFGRRFLKQESAAHSARGGCACMEVLHGAGTVPGAASAKSAQDYFCNNLTAFLAQKPGPKPVPGRMPCVEAGFQSVGHVPIRFHDQFLGSIHLADRLPDRFTPDIIGFMDVVASFMGEALHRFQVEEALLESEERFRSLFEKHDAMMLLMCPTSGKVLDANPAATRFYGWSREKLRTMNIRDLGLALPSAPALPQLQAGVTPGKRFETSTNFGPAATHTVEVYSSPILLQRHPVVFAIMHDVTERKLLERQIVEISELERQRIGRDLHDSLGGHLTGVALLTKAMAQTMTEQELPHASMAAEIVEDLNKAVDMTRAISHGLCPVEPGAHGLVDGLLEFVSGIRQRTGVACRCRVGNGVSIPDAVVSSHLFRIVEEAVQNALRHARPKSIEIRLRRSRGGHLLTIWNDGRPLPPRLDLAKGMGLRTMRFRANLLGGELELRRAPDGGTEVSCLVPDGSVPQGRAAAIAPPHRAATDCKVPGGAPHTDKNQA